MGSDGKSDQPVFRHGTLDLDDGGGFFSVRHDDPRRAELEAEHAAVLRARLGDEVYERMERSRALHKSPRPLAEDEVAVLRAAVAPLLRDLESTGRALPDIREEAHEDRGGDAVCAWIQEPGSGWGQGISVWLIYPPAEQLCELAEQLQDWAGDVQLGREPWPDCRDHPGAHVLRPDTGDESAVWRCPHSKRVIAAIGALCGPGRAG
jgi:hypothetical protein